MVPRDDGHPIAVDIQIALVDTVGVLDGLLGGLPVDGDLLLFGGLLLVNYHHIDVQVHAAIVASIRRMVVAELLAVLPVMRGYFEGRITLLLLAYLANCH